MTDACGPEIDPEAWVSPDATVFGDVRIGAGSRILPGARLVAEGGGRIRIGRFCIVMENAVLRASSEHPLTIGDHCLFGPVCHVVGASIADEVFIATGASVFHGAVIEERAEVRVHGTVHLRTRLAVGATVPIGWIAVGDPAEILPPDRHDEIWAIQKPLGFTRFVYGVDGSDEHSMWAITEGVSRRLGP